VSGTGLDKAGGSINNLEEAFIEETPRDSRLSKTERRKRCQILAIRSLETCLSAN
jgi:hypothetical protein